MQMQEVDLFSSFLSNPEHLPVFPILCILPCRVLAALRLPPTFQITEKPAFPVC